MGGTRGRGVVAVVAPRGRFLFFVVPHSGGVCGDGGKSSYSHQTRANKGRRGDFRQYLNTTGLKNLFALPGRPADFRGTQYAIV